MQASNHANLQAVPAMLCLLCGGVVLRDGVPIDHIPKGSDVIRPTVLILQIVGMFPNVEAEDRLIAAAASSGSHDRAILVRGAFNDELARLVDGEPSPAAAEARGSSFGEVFFEMVPAHQVFLNGFGEFALRLSAFAFA